MLLKLTPSDISIHYDKIAQAFEEAAPDHITVTPTARLNMMKNLMGGQFTAWTIVEDDIDSGIIITTLTYDGIFDEKNLLIYAVRGFEPLSIVQWTETFDSLKTYAEGLDCDNVIVYTNVERIKRLMKSFGAEVNTQLLSVKLDKKEVSDVVSI